MQGVLFHLGAVNIHHDDFRRTGPGFPVIAHLADGNAGAHSQNQVCVLDGPVARAVAHIAGTTAVKRVFVLDQVHGVPVGHNGDVQLFRHGAERCVPAGKPDAVPGVEHRALGVADLFQHHLHGGIVHRGRQPGIVLRRVIAGQAVGFNVAALIVDRDIDPHRAGAAGGCQVPGFFQHIADLVRVFQHGGVFGHGGNRFGDIVFLVAHRAQGQAIGKLRGIAGRGIVPNLAGDHEHRDGIQPAAHHTGQGVGAAGAGSNAQGGNFVINTGVCFRRNGTCLLVMVIGNVQRRVVAQCIIQMHGAAAHHAEHIRNAVRRKKIGHIIGQTLFH